MQSLEKEELERGMKREGDREGADEGWEEDTEDFRPIHNAASAYNIPNLLQQQTCTEEPELTFLPEEDVAGHASHVHPDPNTSLADEHLSAKDTLVHSTPVDKSRNLQQFLASLPPMPLVISNIDDGIGENIPTSNSGSAYSSPMYTPPDEESIHMHISKHRDEQKREQEADTHVSSTAGVCSAGDSVISGTQLHLTEVVGCPVSRSGGSPIPSSSPKSSPPPPPLATPLSSSSTTRHQQQQQQIQAPPLAVANMPVTHSHRSHSLPFGLSGYVIRGDAGSTSAKKPSNISPTNSRASISSLARRSPAVPEENEENGSREMGEGERQGPLSLSLPGNSSSEIPPEEEQVARTDKRLDEICSDSPSLDGMTPRTREKFMHHRRTKSDSHDMSGPIKTAQIFSVPERVKEIEEKGLQISAAQLLQAVNQSDTQSCPPESRHSLTSSTSRSSSEESLVPPFTDSATDGDKPSNSHIPPSSIADSLTRHISLSPKPSSARSTATDHLLAQTSMSLPTSVSPPDYECASPQPIISQDELVSSLQGVVKAKIQDIESKKTPQSASEKTELRNGFEAVVKRTAVSTVQRPLSEIIFHRPYVGMVEVNNPNDSESQGSTASGRETEGNTVYRVQRRNTASTIKGLEGSKAYCMGRRNTTCEMLSSNSSEKSNDSRDRIHSEAVFNAWAGILPVKDLRADDLASVLELRQKFESKKGSPKEHRWPQSSLRRSRSLRDTRLLAPLQRLGGSGRWKKFSSNASLQLSGNHQRTRSSVSPPSHCSQQSLS